MHKEEKKLSELTGIDLSILFRKLQKNELIFRCSFSQISKHLLKDFLSINPFKVDFETLVKAYLEHIEFDEEDDEIDEDGIEHELMRDFRKKNREEIINATKNETEFHKYVCKSYFDLVKEPKEELLNAFIKATEHLKEIDNTLDTIQKHLEKITKDNNSSEIQEIKPILYYYKEHNERAKLEILTFLKTGIKDYAISQCYGNSILSGLMKRVRYSYDWNPKSYIPRRPNDLENKFGKLLFSDFEKISEQYKNDKPTFYSFLNKYIKDEHIVYSIRDLIQHHHVLDQRKEIIEETLNIYEHGAKTMFTVAVPSIIEGIFHDLCLLVGENDNDLLKEGFQQKLDKLQKHLGIDLYYEYYSFRFRLFRNKVSHGRLAKKDVDELADLLLLDLYQVCQLVQSDKLKLNLKRFVIEELNKNLAKPDYKYLMQYILLDETEIPSFYKLNTQIDEVENLINSSEFWSYLETEIDFVGEHVKHGIAVIVAILRKRKTHDTHCANIFKKLGIKKPDKVIATPYLKYLVKDYF